MSSLAPRSSRRPSSLPFWVLIAAWFCANSPQNFTYEFVVWAGSARHFTHQQKLTAEVAFVLTGTKAPQLIASIQQSSSAKPFAPSLPKEATIKKVELGLASAPEPWTPNVSPESYVLWEGSPPAAPPLLLPYEPPRGGLIT